MKLDGLRKGAFVLSKYTPIHDEAYTLGPCLHPWCGPWTPRYTLHIYSHSI